MDQIDAQATMTGTMEVPEQDRLDETRLTAWFEANVEGFAGPLSLSKFKGGQSNPTYKVTTPNAAYVLRRKPFGPLLPSAHAVDREYRVQAALFDQGFPVSRQYGLCEDDSVIGSMFYVMGFTDGASYWDGTLPGKTPEQRTAIYNAMIDTLAHLHSFDPVAIGLESYGKPGNYCARQISRWTKQYRLSETETIPEMDQLIEWLEKTVPEQRGFGIAHGDFRIDNMIFDKDEPRVLALLDWELSTLGDPIADLSYFLMSWVQPAEGRNGLLGVDVKALGIPTIEEATARYVEKAGLDHVPDMDWYLAYNQFRIAAILQGIKKRVIDGTASSAQAEQMAQRVIPLAQAAWEYAKKAGAQ
ncbi:MULTISPECIES: phosphotransferase family protein [Blastomonas]|jgi:aminoglycoside phosphotransferase (APT) family kinase protein|uniref:Phosphotransferase family protein n=1 Tax=Blastomonas fulva TaxID=1550728 RepID=A0ABM6M9J1_9SPHN|nr:MULTISPECIES: phosphotransferase family protein [Blastomonas]AOG01548.1 ecdysteroid kinase family protein [Blastomonas sp. RAC04]ASR52594.1 phosphotransferase family protein [Blastomonas fulva]KPF74506.1 aminoglycoside phosphotransferase [Blastomonas sp. AAP25]